MWREFKNKHICDLRTFELSWLHFYTVHSSPLPAPPPPAHQYSVSDMNIEENKFRIVMLHRINEIYRRVDNFPAS